MRKRVVDGRFRLTLYSKLFHLHPLKLFGFFSVHFSRRKYNRGKGGKSVPLHKGCDGRFVQTIPFMVHLTLLLERKPTLSLSHTHWILGLGGVGMLSSKSTRIHSSVSFSLNFTCQHSFFPSNLLFKNCSLALSLYSWNEVMS